MVTSGFIEKGEWILPTEGTLGAKAQNLLANTPLIKKHGFHVPKSLGVPWEYLDELPNPSQTTLDLIDEYFPEWKRIVVRSSSPDEDIGQRIPGLYKSDDIWHKDRDYAFSRIYFVLHSYFRMDAALRREALGMPDLGMSLLIQQPVCNSYEYFDADYSGALSYSGEMSELVFTDPTKGLEAMLEPCLETYNVGTDGVIAGEASSEHRNLACKLIALAKALPGIPGKGWEIEFVGDKRVPYVVQTTPIHKSEPVVIPDDAKSIFSVRREVVGTGLIRTEGILHVPTDFDLQELVRFDVTHGAYCLATSYSNIGFRKSGFSSRHLIPPILHNAKVMLVVCAYGGSANPFPPHVRQFMREGRVTLLGVFTNSLQETLEEMDPFITRSVAFGGTDTLSYSPTRLVVAANEAKYEAIVALPDGTIHPFAQLR